MFDNFNLMTLCFVCKDLITPYHKIAFFLSHLCLYWMSRINSPRLKHRGDHSRLFYMPSKRHTRETWVEFSLREWDEARTLCQRDNLAMIRFEPRSTKKCNEQELQSIRLVHYNMAPVPWNFLNKVFFKMV